MFGKTINNSFTTIVIVIYTHKHAHTSERITVPRLDEVVDRALIKSSYAINQV